jgi:hypothetical protein
MYATCVTLPSDATTAESIEALIPGTPEGLVAHVAGPVDEGWRIIDVWQSEEHCRRFQADVLGPVIAQVVQGPAHDIAPLTVTGQLERLAV